MLKDDEIKVSCGRNLWPVKRNYITRQSEKNVCSQSIKKRKILNESVNGIVNNVCNVKLNEVKNEKHSEVHSIANKLSNKLSLQNDAKNAIIHSFTNVKAPVFKYSKCRTCRIPCSGDVFKSGKFEVNVRKLSISECLKFKDFRAASSGGSIKKDKVNHSKEEVRGSPDKDRVKKTRSQNRDFGSKDGKNHINKDNHGLKTVEFELKDKEKDSRKISDHQDLSVGCKDSKNKDLDVSVGNRSPSTLNLITLNGDRDLISVKVDDIGKVNSDVQNGNNCKVDPVFTEGLGVNTIISDLGKGNIDDANNDNAELITKSIPELDEISGSSVTNDSHDLINGNCENNSNGIHDLKNGGIDLNKEEKDLNVCAVNLKNCVVDLRDSQFKTNSSIINDENIFSMVLRSRKCMVNKDNSKCHDTKNLISDIKNISIDLQKKHALNTRKLDPGINFVGKENKSIVNCESSSKSGIAECDIEVSQNDASIAEAAVCISDSDSMSSKKIDTVIAVSNKKCEPFIEQNSQILQSTSFSDKDENCIKTDCIDESHLQGVKASEVKLTKLSDAAETSNVNCFSDCNGNNGIVEFNGAILGDTIEENWIICKQKDIHENGECNQSCKCGADFSASSRCIVDLNRNINSEYCREHNLRHNRKHVRLKDISENQLDSTSHDLLEKEPITLYIFESVRRLEFLHNHFYTSIVKPDDDILQYMLEDIEIDIEILDEDKNVSIEEEHDDSSSKQDSSSLSEEEQSDMLSKCEWDDCTLQFNDSMKLLDHLKTSHINETSDRTLVSCLWRKCKFSNQQCSYKWLSNHIMKHCSVHPFKCVILGCDLSFATQSGLARHVPSHFNEGKVRRTCVTTGIGRENGKTKFDMTSNFMENGEENEDIGEPARKKTKYEKFVERYKATCTVKNNVQSVINGIKCKLQISASNSSLNCGFVGRYFRFNHRVIGKRTSKDGSTDMLLCPSSTKIFPYKSFWFDGSSLAKHKSLYVDISVNDLSDDVKQHIYDNEQIARVNSKEKKVSSV